MRISDWSSDVCSSDLTLVERYPVPGGEALHLDLYRIGGAGELEFLGLDDADAALWLVEWPERGAGGLPAADLRVDLSVEGAGRAVRLRAGGAAGDGWVKRMENRGDLRTRPESNTSQRSDRKGGGAGKRGSVGEDP